MPRPQKPIPATVSIQRWAEEITDTVLAGMDPIHRAKLPRDILVALAHLCFDADDRLRFERKQKERPWWTLLEAALSAEFGFAIEFMAQVRRQWFEERGAKGGIHTVDASGLKLGTEATVRLLLRHPAWHAWENQFSVKNRRKPTHKERAAKMADFGFKIADKQVKKVWDEFPPE